MCDKGIPRDEYTYHHLLEALRLGNQADLMMECTDWLRDDDVRCGAHLYIVRPCSTSAPYKCVY